MYAKSTRPSAKREVQKERSAQSDDRVLRSAKRDDRIAHPGRTQTCERSAQWECARKAGRFFFIGTSAGLYVDFLFFFSILEDYMQIMKKLDSMWTM